MKNSNVQSEVCVRYQTFNGDPEKHYFDMISEKHCFPTNQEAIEYADKEFKRLNALKIDVEQVSGFDQIGVGAITTVDVTVRRSGKLIHENGEKHIPVHYRDCSGRPC